MAGPNPVLLGPHMKRDGHTETHQEYWGHRGKNVCKDTARSYHLQAKRSSEETKPATTLVLDFEPQEL